MSLGNFIDFDFLLKVAGQLGKFRQYQTHKWNFRCPFCGDSTDLSKAHAYVFPNLKKPGRLSFKCFKCGHSDNMHGLLKLIDEAIYKQYQREMFTSSRISFSGPLYTEVPVQNNAKEIVLRPENFFQSVVNLPPNHPANVYLGSRKVPVSQSNRIWFTDEFWATLKNLNPEQKIREAHDEPRIIFPIMDPTGSFMVALQGRSLDPEAKLRYVDCQLVKNQPRMFGQERINSHTPVILTEGPIDSLFLENAVGLCGAQRNPEGLPNNRIFYLDQEPRNPQIMKRYQDLIDSGESVIMLPDEFFNMDVNDIAQSTGWSRKEMTEFVLAHVKSGLKARLKLSEWMKLTPIKKLVKERR